jgi:hypothetical protein
MANKISRFPFGHFVMSSLLCLSWMTSGSFAGAQTPLPANTKSDGSSTVPQATSTPGNFVDITTRSHVAFAGQASHTAKKYLLETMGSGVALFDYDNDGRLDIFFVNGAPLTDPMAKGTIPQKTGPSTGIVFSIKRTMAPSKTLLRRPAFKGSAMAWESPWATMTTTDTKICT